MEFIKIQKPIIVEAIEIKKEVVMNTKKGEMTAQVGDWVIVDKKKGNIIIDAEKFEKTYESVDLPKRVLSEYEKKLETIKNGEKILTPEQKIAMFGTEINYIRNDSIKEFAIAIVKELPSYFFEIPASSGGKYHPEYARKPSGGGLHLHTVVAIKNAVEGFKSETRELSEIQKDLSIAVLLVHDGFKSGLAEEQGKFTAPDHAMISAKFFKENEKINNMLPEDLFEMFLRGLARHMGKWNTATDFNTNITRVVAKVPETDFEIFISECDYTASRKHNEVNFDEPTIRDDVVKEEKSEKDTEK